MSFGYNISPFTLFFCLFNKDKIKKYYPLRIAEANMYTIH